MYDEEDSRLTYELSRYLTNTEWDRIERTKKFMNGSRVKKN